MGRTAVMPARFSRSEGGRARSISPTRRWRITSVVLARQRPRQLPARPAPADRQRPPAVQSRRRRRRCSRASPAAPSRSFPTCWIAGQSESYIETGSHGETVLLGAQFRSHGAYRLLRLAQHELQRPGHRTRSAARRPACSGCASACSRLRRLRRASRCSNTGCCACSNAERKSTPPSSKQAARSPRSHGQIDLPALSRHTGFSREHLIRRFREQVGLTPKAYGNIVRFNRALELARAPASSWAEIAHACGYYDQSHLVRDFQRFAGRAPGTLLRDARPDAASIVIE